MKIDASILKSRWFWGALVAILIACGAPIAMQPQKPDKLRVVQVVDARMDVLRPEDVCLMGEDGKIHSPDNSGIVMAKPGMNSVLDTQTGKVIQVQEIPREGPSPYRLVVRR